ncbi:predicted protein [Sclerotinia sclerotiorum 1980 UF-70]|uniref:Uncharacterized protein n=1 Tax=Sclerotinia sclerotiorum (strain ATCC 18683 / 1980 / Ss-1) TaxID=665079 RepID=A7EMV2_SCLS1|nr:predicted protein [Sclerotinia sclerotiorum 1980 UF-70]EDO04168.1 predicted protein [Sclerotinia sclerotiorum 1980 UF-70]
MDEADIFWPMISTFLGSKGSRGASAEPLIFSDNHSSLNFTIYPIRALVTINEALFKSVCQDEYKWKAGDWT